MSEELERKWHLAVRSQRESGSFSLQRKAWEMVRDQALADDNVPVWELAEQRIKEVYERFRLPFSTE